MLAYAPARGAVIISEVVYNEVGSAATGEWIEIYNNGASAVDLSNYTIGDEETSGGTSTTEALFQFPSGASIAPGQVQIISGDADAFFTIYGFLPTYETAGANVSVPNLTTYATWDPDGGVLNMSNTNDQAVLIGPDDTRVDAVGWGNTNAFNPGLDPDAEGDGQSYERINANIDTDTAADWQLGPASTVAAERSTPGVVAVPEPGAFGLALIGGALAVRRSRRRE
jgi:glycerophosphoryl diester phosphodiesterase